MKLSTTDIKRKNPINRNNFFTSQDQINFQIGIGMEYVNKIVNQTVVLYEIDLYKIDKSELKTYDNDTIKGYYVKVGQLTFSIFEKELEENGCDIKRGDYIGIQVTPEHMEFFVVTDDGRVNYDNRHTLWGTVPYYRSITCAVASDIAETQNI